MYQKKSVLIIDDELRFSLMIQDALEQKGYDAPVEINPNTGIKVYTENYKTIGLVLLDLAMPQMHGSDVIDALRLVNPNVKIIIISGYPKNEVVTQIGLRLAHICHVLHKPFNLEDLFNAVELFIDKEY